MYRTVEIFLRQNKCLEWNKKAIVFIGLWVSDEGTNKSWASVLRQYVPKFNLLLSLLYGFIVFPLGVVSNVGDISPMCECIFLEAVLILVVSKAYSVCLRQQLFESLANKIETMYRKWHVVSKVEKSIESQTQFMTNLTVVIIGLAAAVLVVYIVVGLPIMFVFRTLFIGGWYPHDITVSPNFEFTLLAVVYITTQLIIVPVVDAYFLAILIQTTGQLKIICHRLEHIREIAVEVVNVRNNLGLRRHRQYDLLEESEELHNYRNDNVISRERGDLLAVPIREYDEVTSCSKDSRSGAGYQELEEVKQISRISQSVNLEMERILSDCVKHHVELCGFVVEIESAFSSILNIETGGAVIALAILVMWFTLVTSFDFRALGFVFIAIFGTSEFFLYCWFATELREQSLKIREAVYNLDWFDATEGFKRSMRIIMSRSNQPLVIHVAGFLPLTNETFLNVMKLTHSYYQTLHQYLATRSV